MTSNIAYKTEHLSRFFSQHRKTWDELYPSERKVIESLGISSTSSVLDMGCACGGLGNALEEHYGLRDYCGVDINPQCIDVALQSVPWGTFFQGDFLNIGLRLGRSFDFAFSLGCADWNVRTADLLGELFKSLKVGGKLVFSCRMTDSQDVVDLVEGRQNLLYDASSEEPAEWAPYKVYRLKAILNLLQSLKGSSDIYAYGYWGAVPESVENLPLKKAFFAVFSVLKSETQIGRTNQVTLDFGDASL